MAFSNLARLSSSWLDISYNWLGTTTMSNRIITDWQMVEKEYEVNLLRARTRRLERALRNIYEDALYREYTEVHKILEYAEKALGEDA